MPSTEVDPGSTGQAVAVKRVHVAVGVLANAQQQVFITQRAQHLHQGGLWEFPGGKVERDETAYAALQREMCE